MSENSQYDGSQVVFTDEYGKQRVGRVIGTQASGRVGELVIHVEGEHGSYIRPPSEVRLPELWEVDRAAAKQGYLE